MRTWRQWREGCHGWNAGWCCASCRRSWQIISRRWRHMLLGQLLWLCCTRLNKRPRRECNFWKAMITTLKYFGLCVVPAHWLPGWLAKSEAYVVPKTKYMTLGPKFYAHNKMVITRRRKHLQSWILAEWPILSHVDSESEVLLRFKAIWRKFACDLGFAGYVLLGFPPRRAAYNTER